MPALRRLRGVLTMLSFLALTLGACSAVLSLTIGRDPRTFLGSDWPSYTLISHQNAGSQVSGVLKEGPRPGTRVGILLGSSTLECGVDPTALGEGTSMPWRWVSLCGKGTTTAVLEKMGEKWFKSRLRPEVLVLAVNLGMLAQAGDYMADRDAEDVTFDPKSLAKHLAARRWRAAADDLRTLCVSVPNRVFPARTRVNNRTQYGIFLTRTALFDSIGLGTDVIHNPAPNPWVLDPYWARGPHLSESEIRTQLAGYTERGWFDAANYSVGGPNTRALVNLIGKARSQGTEVVLVLMPEKAIIHKLVPAQAEHVMRTALREAFGDETGLIIDLRDSMPEKLFRDTTHLDPDGLTEFTRRLSRALDAHLKGRAVSVSVAVHRS
jgi:hypothetical protein